MSRLLAVVGAIVMVALAVVVRDQVIEGDRDDGGASAGVDIVCVRELPADACDTRASLDETIDVLQGDDDPGLAWLAPGPWAEEFPELDERSPLAETELVAVVHRTPPQCASGLTWQCLGDAAAAGGRISAPPRDSAVRVLVRAALLGGHIARTSYAINDDDVVGAIDWLISVETAIDSARNRQARTVGEFIAIGPAAGDVFLTTRADAAGAATVTAPSPRVGVVAVLAATDEVDGERARLALLDAGWDPPSSQTSTGLPSPGVLLALREVV